MIIKKHNKNKNKIKKYLPNKIVKTPECPNKKKYLSNE